MTRPIAARLLDRVSIHPITGCFEWTGYRNARGYGVIGVGSRPEGTHRPALAHRVAYTEWVGPIGAGLEIDHLCRNHACIRPDHLEAVSHQEKVSWAK